MANINKTDLVALLSDRTDLTSGQAHRAIDVLCSAIKEQTEAGHTVAIHAFGKFTMKERAARTGRNPATGAPIEIAASRALSFKPSKSST